MDMSITSDRMRYELASNVLSSDEVGEILGCTRQHVSLLTREGHLHPLKKMSKGVLYLRADVDDYLMKSGYDSASSSNRINDMENVRTHKLIDEWEQTGRLEQVQAAFLYNRTLDAAMDGFFELQPYFHGPLRTVSSPTFVLRFTDGQEFWSTGANCGYEGTGPHLAVSFLERCGFSQNDLEPVLSNQVVKLFRDENGTVDVYAHDGVGSDKSTDVRLTSNTLLYAKDGQLVLLETMLDSSTDQSVETLETYRKFLPRPTEVIVMTKESAEASGYIHKSQVNELGHKTVFNVVVKDASGRELWLSPAIDIKSERDILKQGTVREILNACGCNTDVEDSSLKGWMLSLLQSVAPPKKGLFVYKAN